jgi:hypothetical protein
VLAGGEDPSSPQSGSGGDFSSPQGLASQQSEQLPFFKDYYSQDEIHPNDKVATLWAYQPRATDEFELERGDMLKVVGIWDDGWATGVRLNERAEDWDVTRKTQRDSGVSNGSGRRGSSPPPPGEIKAFPVSIVSPCDFCLLMFSSSFAFACQSIGKKPSKEMHQQMPALAVLRLQTHNRYGLHCLRFERHEWCCVLGRRRWFSIPGISRAP